MESRLPKPNFQFKVPARTVTGTTPITIPSISSNSTIDSSSSGNSTINSSTGSNGSTTNSLSASNISEKIDKLKSNHSGKTETGKTTTKSSQAITKTVSTTNISSKGADENKAPITRAKTMTTISRPNVVARGIQKRPGLVNNAVEPKRANLKTSMKPMVRPVRPATTVGPIGRTLATTVTATTAKPAAAKPSKWDLKGRLEYTTNELTTLKQKHREITTQYNDIQDEIISLRESESTNRLKAEKLEKAANDFNKDLASLKAEIERLTKEKDILAKELEESKDMYEKVSASFEQCKTDLIVKETLITSQDKEIKELKETLEIQDKTSTEKITLLETKNAELTALVQNLDRDRRYLHNAIQELKGNIRVFCRVRPKIPKEASKRYKYILH